MMQEKITDAVNATPMALIKCAKGRVKAKMHHNRSEKSPYAQATTPAGSTKHINSVYHATLLYLSSCVGIYISVRYLA